MQDEFVTVHVFYDSPSAWLLRNRLELANVRAFVVDDHFACMKWIMINAIGGIKVQVPRNQLERANEIINEDPVPFDSEAAEEFEGLVRVDNVPMSCVRCGSSKLANLKYVNRWVYLIWIFVGCPLPLVSRGLTCFDCDFVAGPKRFFHGPKTPLWLPVSLFIMAIFAFIFFLSCLFNLFAGLNF